LQEAGVLFEGMVLKPNMVIKGKDCKDTTTNDELAKITVQTLLRTVIPAVPGIFFLSGG
jgi:fructose-bisphosphate aldolase class I